MTAKELLDKYISFFEKRGHKVIPNSSLVPENDPTTLFTSSGMQALVPYLLGEPHPQGKRLVNVQNCFRAQDILEIGDNRHTTFFRMLGNWSLGDYFKKEQLPWFWEFLVKELELAVDKLYVSVFEGYQDIPKDVESYEIWKSLGLLDEHIFFYGADKNWWSRAGTPEDMPAGEPGGPDSEVFYEFDIDHNPKFGKECHLNCQCGRFLEIGNSVFMEYQKKDNNSFKKLPQKNVDFGGGLERLLAAVENQQDIFQTSLFTPIIRIIEQTTEKDYSTHANAMRIIADHFIAAVFIVANKVRPSNKEQGYILRRLLRRGLDHFRLLGGKGLEPILETIVANYKDTDPILEEKYENIRFSVVIEENLYRKTLELAKQFVTEKYRPVGNELKGAIVEISADDAFTLYATHGLSPMQIKSLGFTFDAHVFAQKMKEHQKASRASAVKKFAQRTKKV